MRARGSRFKSEPLVSLSPPPVASLLSCKAAFLTSWTSLTVVASFASRRLQTPLSPSIISQKRMKCFLSPRRDTRLLSARSLFPGIRYKTLHSSSIHSDVRASNYPREIINTDYLLSPAYIPLRPFRSNEYRAKGVYARNDLRIFVQRRRQILSFRDIEFRGNGSAFHLRQGVPPCTRARRVSRCVLSATYLPIYLPTTHHRWDLFA